MEKIVKTKEILIEINEVFECRWSANIHLKLLTIFEDVSDFKNRLGNITILILIFLNMKNNIIFSVLTYFFKN